MGSLPTSPPKVVWGKVVGRLKGKVVDEPAVAQRAVGHIGDAQLARRVNQPVGLVERLKGRVLGLDGVNGGDCRRLVSNFTINRNKKRAVVLELALRRVAAEHSDRPMYLVLPALRSASSAGIDWSRGVST